ncbi:MarR family winged helix-turn-helix transcriptional regulator [Cohnella herbarum]|uniref:MarR family transcriptional regulator n=1 Tax=Cohnella herbarum TaxID=2728023 RepID=A0A7Z2VLP2_9BACL|nr:MarR family transcriptional regulator [Cohnella herbarum]QJD85393.1 MarR family transcriptional regulator [Cohnella herbarum]
MRTELLDSVSESFVTAVPLIKKNLLRSFSIDHIPFQLSRSNLEALFSLNELRSASVSQLCNHLGISPPNMTPLIDKLVINGLANRTTSTEDRRVVQIEITEDGEQLCIDLQRRLAEQIRSKLDSLSDEDLIELRQCMRSLRNIASKIIG